MVTLNLIIHGKKIIVYAALINIAMCLNLIGKPKI